MSSIRYDVGRANQSNQFLVDIRDRSDRLNKSFCNLPAQENHFTMHPVMATRRNKQRFDAFTTDPNICTLLAARR